MHKIIATITVMTLVFLASATIIPPEGDKDEIHTIFNELQAEKVTSKYIVK